MEIEQLCMKHPAVLAEIEKLQLPPGMTVCNDPWMYGTDSEHETRRLYPMLHVHGRGRPPPE
jgi:primary-amine oxidase